MAIGTISRDIDHDEPPRRGAPETSLRSALQNVLKPLASLKLTVALFALAIFLVFTGTLAQTRHDVWWVMYHYFRTPIAWIELNVFFPPAWFSESPGLLSLPGAIPFPGGFTIGGLMALNLLAAHGVRFKIQASGARLASGLGVIALGCLLTWLVVATGPDNAGARTSMPMEWQTIWNCFLWGLVVAVAGISAAIIMLPASRRAERIILSITGLALTALLAFLWFKIDIRKSDPDAMLSSMRILWQVFEAGIAALVLLAGCALVFRKRAGIVLIHAGIGLIMLNEVVVYALHHEAQMTMAEGQTANFAQDSRTVELAVIDTKSNPTEDDVVVVPERILRDSLAEKKLISSPLLPFNVEVEEYFENSLRRKATPEDKVVADRGIGRLAVLVPQRPVVGTDREASNFPGAYIAISEKGTGKPLGTFLMWSMQPLLQPVTVGDKEYEIVLRFERVYKPYTMRLENVTAENYPGTDVAKKYESKLDLIDKEHNVDRPVRIRMNEPLHYSGETMYQSGFYQDPDSKVKYSTLQIVTNFGWMIPYMACVIVGIGLLAHFSQILVRFLRRRGRESFSPADLKLAKTLPEKDSRPLWVNALTYVPAIAAAAFLAYSTSAPKSAPSEFDLYAFGKMPVLAGGRVAPIDTLARNTLRMLALREVYVDEGGGIGAELSEKEDGSVVVDHVDLGSSAQKAGLKAGDKVLQIDDQSTAGQTIEAVRAQLDDFQIPQHGRSESSARLKVANGDEAPRELVIERRTQPAIKWLLELATHPDAADTLRVIRIDNLDVLAMLNLDRRPYYRYSMAEINAARGALEKARDSLKGRDATSYTVYEKKVKEVFDRMQLYELVRLAFWNGIIPPIPTDEEAKAHPEQAAQVMGAIKTRLQNLAEFNAALEENHAPQAIPPSEADIEVLDQFGGYKQDQWTPYSLATMIALIERIRGKEANPATVAWQTAMDAYDADDATAFNRTVAHFAESMKEPPAQLAKSAPDFEAWFNHWGPFMLCQWLYFTAFCIAVLAWMGWSGPLNRAAFWLIAVTFVGHSLALAFRMYIAGRPPVTNLYSSAIFIGWAAVLAGLVLEAVFRRGFGNVLAAVAGFGTLMIAYRLSMVLDSTNGDTIGVQLAVLDTSFWLATHVTCVTLGYAATYVAGLLGLIYVVRGLFTRGLSATDGKDLVRMIYGTVCFAIFFSFVGTVLGGLWADDSWGRFWGWDPKENGALIIVLWNALVLHARWQGMVKDRGLAVLAIGGNIVTSWSYFGVNQLGVGLHSYGFTEGILVALGTFCASQIAMIAAGSLPLRYWRSERTENRLVADV